MRIAIAGAMLLGCAACSDEPRSASGGETTRQNMAGSPAPEGTIVDLPMDSISNQDMIEGNEDAPYEGQVVESDR